jgi:hypothetical protein
MARRAAALAIGLGLALASTPAGASRLANDPSFVGKYKVFVTQGAGPYQKGVLTLKKGGTAHDRLGIPGTWSNTRKNITFELAYPPAFVDNVYTGKQTPKGFCNRTKPCTYTDNGGPGGMWYAVKKPAK